MTTPKSILKNQRNAATIKSLNSKVYKNRIALSTGSGLEIVHIDQILFCQASSNYCTVTLRGGKSITICKSLKQVQQYLNPQMFLRVHQSYLIQVEAITQFGTDLILEENHEIPISRAMRSKVKTRIQMMCDVL